MGIHIQIVAFKLTWDLMVLCKEAESALAMVMSAVQQVSGSELVTPSAFDMGNYPFYARVTVANMLSKDVLIPALDSKELEGRISQMMASMRAVKLVTTPQYE